MISAKLADRLGFHALYMTGYGVAASHLGLPDAGIASYGDVVERVEDRKVTNLDDFRDAMERVSAKSRFLIVARRSEETKFLLVKPAAVPIEEADGEPADEVGLPD